MRKVVIFGFVIIICLGWYWGLDYLQGDSRKVFSEKRLAIEEDSASIEELYIYGRSLNLKGTLKVEDIAIQGIKLVLYHNKMKTYNLNYQIEDTVIHFWVSDRLNTGIILDDIALGNYCLFIELSFMEDGKPLKKYYSLVNQTDYPKTTYHAFSGKAKKIDIASEQSYPTTLLNVQEFHNDNVYDIVLDPGHGGLDSGAVNGKYRESSLTYELAVLLKKKLIKMGLTVKLTHNGDISGDEVLDSYNDNGRAVIPQKVKAKYLFSLHFNSSVATSVNGLEIYTPDGIDYTLAQNLVNNLTRDTDMDYSSNKSFKIANGIYTRNFSESEIELAKKEAKGKGRKPYPITTGSNYFYMIRETGGIMTGAYVDDRNATTVGVNPYYNSNVGVESYLLELGYITNQGDLMNFLNNKEEYASTIAQTIYDYLYPGK